MTRLHVFIVILMTILLISPVETSAQSGDTLLPVTPEAEAVKIYPEDAFTADEVKQITGRVREARNSGAPVAVRVVDLTAPPGELPSHFRQFASTDLSQPLPDARVTYMLNTWIGNEPIESEPGADDGFLLLVLTGADPTQTQAFWHIGPNALPLNGLTSDNIAATQSIMKISFTNGSVANGVYLGMSEFSYNIQFGSPERLQRSNLGEALHAAVTPLALVTAMAGAAIPALALWFTRRRSETRVDAPVTLDSPWQAAAVSRGRATADIPAAMLFAAYHRGEIQQLDNGALAINAKSTDPAVQALSRFANSDGILTSDAVQQVSSITAPVSQAIEEELTRNGAFTSRAQFERGWMLILMGVAGFLALLTLVPSVLSMSRLGIFAIAFVLLTILQGWWWISTRRLTTPAGEDALRAWLERAAKPDLALFETATRQSLLTDPVGGPNVPNQTQLVRKLRGLGSG